MQLRTANIDLKLVHSPFPSQKKTTLSLLPLLCRQVQRSRFLSFNFEIGPEQGLHAKAAEHWHKWPLHNKRHTFLLHVLDSI
jgi:hypothetical protein